MVLSHFFQSLIDNSVRNSEDPDLVLHCMPAAHTNVARLKCAKENGC